MTSLFNLSPFWQALAGSLLGGFLSMAAAACFTFALPRRWIVRLVSFSAGLLLAVALLDLLPEAVASGMTMERLGLWLLLGLVGLYLLERSALWRHDHAGEAGHHHDQSVPPLLIMSGDTLHNFTDGVLLAAAFLVDPALGWSTALAVAAHEVPQEVGDFVLLREAGWSRGRAFFWNAVSSLGSVLGMVVGWVWLEQARDWLPVVMTLAAASFLYIAVSDLLPWLKRQREGVAWQAGLLASGVGAVMAGATWFH
ncbi:ZIP family metal transporter [Denitratisoma sp. agr-D3]